MSWTSNGLPFLSASESARSNERAVQRHVILSRRYDGRLCASSTMTTTSRSETPIHWRKWFFMAGMKKNA